MPAQTVKDQRVGVDGKYSKKTLKFTSWVGMCWRVETLAWPHHEGIHKMEQIHDFFNQQMFVGAVAFGGSYLCGRVPGFGWGLASAQAAGQ